MRETDLEEEKEYLLRTCDEIKNIIHILNLEISTLKHMGEDLTEKIDAMRSSRVKIFGFMRARKMRELIGKLSQIMADVDKKTFRKDNLESMLDLKKRELKECNDKIIKFLTRSKLQKRSTVESEEMSQMGS